MSGLATISASPPPRRPSREFLAFGKGTLFDFFKEAMLTANGDVHRRRRAPFSKRFAARMIADMQPRI
jgi:hypothetical protein